MTEKRDRVVELFKELDGNISAVAREMQLDRATIRFHLRKAGAYDKTSQNILEGEAEPTQNTVFATPKRGVKTYVLTSAQNNTRVHRPFWDNLQALVKHYKARLIVGTYSYNTGAYSRLQKRGHMGPHDKAYWYDNELLPFIENGDDENIELAPGLVWCGRANILPTAVRPLSGFETYTGLASAIFPHAKLALESRPTPADDPSKMLYTTGTATQLNYIQRKAGLKAEHHHTYAALIVEVDTEGDWFVRQVNADANGTIYDLDVKVENGRIKNTGRIEGLTCGDIHHSKLNYHQSNLLFGPGGMADTLRPDFVFLHDLIDFTARRHHNRNDPHQLFQLFVDGKDSVESEFIFAAGWLKECQGNHPRSEFVVVDSNHDRDFERWLRETDYREDPLNAEFFLEAQLQKYRSIRSDTDFHACEWALRKFGAPKKVRFLREDESFIIAGDIECGMHGHLGPNGSRGSPANLARVGRKANTAHTHSASIVDGLYTAGVTAKLRQGYNRGPSSWSHSHILTYPNGKRAIITTKRMKWRASR